MMKKLLSLFVFSLLLSPVAIAEFTSRWNKVYVLPDASETFPTIQSYELDDKGFVCKIRLQRYSQFTLWTTNATPGWAVSSLDVSTSKKADVWAERHLAETSPTVSTDTDGNFRATLASTAWSDSDPNYVTFYFQFKGKAGTPLTLAYQASVVSQPVIVIGTAESPELITFSDSANPAVWYDEKSRTCHTNGTWWFEADLEAGRKYCYGATTNSASKATVAAYYPSGSVVPESRILPYAPWIGTETNVVDVAQHLTNFVERTEILTEYQTVENERLTVTNIVYIAGVYTNDVDGTWTLVTNFLSVVTNEGWQAAHIQSTVSVVTNTTYETLSVCTNIVSVTNFYQVGLCYYAWQMVPEVSGRYRFAVRGGEQKAFVFANAAMMARKPCEHPGGRVVGIGEDIPLVPGFLNNPTSGAYDGVIDDCLYAVDVMPGSTYLFSLTGADTELLMRVYDSSGAVLAQKETSGSAELRVSSAEPRTYVGVCMKPVCDENGTELGVQIGTKMENVQIGTRTVRDDVMTGYTVSIQGADVVTNEVHCIVEREEPVYGPVEMPVYDVASNEVHLVVRCISDIADDADPADDLFSGSSFDGRVVYCPTVLLPGLREKKHSGNLFVDDAADCFSLRIHPDDVVRLALSSRIAGGDAVLELVDNGGTECLVDASGFVCSGKVASAVLFRIVHADPAAPADSSYDLVYSKVGMSIASGVDDEYLFDRSSSPFSSVRTTTFDGWVCDRDGVCRGVIKVKLPKARSRTGLPKADGTLTMLGSKNVKLSGALSVNENEANCILSGRGFSANLHLTADGMHGSLSPGYYVYGAKNADDTRVNAYAQKISRHYGRTYAFALKTIEAAGQYSYLSDGFSAVSVQIKNKAKAKVLAFLADGTKVSTKSTVIAGDGFCVVPLLLQAYSKKGGLSGLLWIMDNGQLYVDNLSEWNAAPSPTPFTAMLSLVAGPDAAPKSISGSLCGIEGYGNYPVEAKPLDGIRIRYAPATGAINATVQYFVMTDSGRFVKKSAKFAGVAVGDVGYGAAVVKKQLSVPLVVR